MCKKWVVLSLMLCLFTPAMADVSIGLNLSLFPQLEPVPGYPVYYAPGVSSNYFFYDGMYWVYQDDAWFASTWYNGPWNAVEPEMVPSFILRVPVRYYRQAPSYFSGWDANASPRWGDHWGGGWSQRRGGWDQWDHNQRVDRSPIPAYQQQYAGSRYPAPAQQQALQNQHHEIRPHDELVRQLFQQPHMTTGMDHAQHGVKATPPAAPPQSNVVTPGPVRANPPTSAQPRPQASPRAIASPVERPPIPGGKSPSEHMPPPGREQAPARPPQEVRSQPVRTQEAPVQHGERPQDAKQKDERHDEHSNDEHK